VAPCIEGELLVEDNTKICASAELQAIKMYGLQHHPKATKCSTRIPVHGKEGILHNYRKYRKKYPIASFSRQDSKCFVIYIVDYSMSGSLNLSWPYHKTRPLGHYGVLGEIKTVCGFCGVFPSVLNHLLNHQPPSNPHHSTHLSDMTAIVKVLENPY
jgi:hypothetical protein